MFERIKKIDNRVSESWTNRRFSPTKEKLLKFYVRLGDGYAWILFVAFVIYKVGLDAFWPILGRALCSFLVSLAVYEGVKLTVKRPRPFAANPKIKAEVPPLDKFSFPSGHTMNNLAVASTVFFSLPAYGWVMLLLPLTWGLLRVYYGVHWLSDIVCGFLFGILSFVIGSFLWIPVASVLAGWLPMLAF
ncbi:MAG: phosphatase PAP2 family protein [Fibrobacter sp.]|nr:phosphatase PAP2 family protein [Fibrobacter sp.]